MSSTKKICCKTEPLSTAILYTIIKHHIRFISLGLRNGNVALFQLSTLHWTTNDCDSASYNDDDDNRLPFIFSSDRNRTTKVPQPSPAPDGDDGDDDDGDATMNWKICVVCVVRLWDLGENCFFFRVANRLSSITGWVDALSFGSSK